MNQPARQRKASFAIPRVLSKMRELGDNPGDSTKWLALKAELNDLQAQVSDRNTEYGTDGRPRHVFNSVDGGTSGAGNGAGLGARRSDNESVLGATPTAAEGPQLRSAFELSDVLDTNIEFDERIQVVGESGGRLRNRDQ